MSLANGRSTHAQMMSTDTIDLRITIPGDVNETWTSCVNNHRTEDAVMKSFAVAGIAH